MKVGDKVKVLVDIGAGPVDSVAEIIAMPGQIVDYFGIGSTTAYILTKQDSYKDLGYYSEGELEVILPVSFEERKERFLKEYSELCKKYEVKLTGKFEGVEYIGLEAVKY